MTLKFNLVSPWLLSLWIVLSAYSTATHAKTINVGFPENFPPFFYTKDDGTHAGISYDIVVRLLEAKGYTVVTKQFDSMQGLLTEVDRGNQDIVVHLSVTSSRTDIALFTKTAHIYETQNFIVRADNPIEYTGQLLQIASKRIGAINGWTHGAQFDEAKFLNKVFVNDSVQQMKGLISGRYDIAVNNPLFFLDIAKHMQIERAFKVLQPEIENLPVHIAVSRKSPQAQELVAELDKAVQHFITTDEYQKLLAKYGFIANKRTSK